MKKICVFCGSNVGTKEIYTQKAQELGRLLAQQELELVYGGGNVGLMGIIADEVLAKGGRVTGVIPNFLMEKELGHTGATDLILTESMHERKQKMADLSDAFIAMPGGAGTLEEISEIFTWAQLGLHQKPIALLNVQGYYDDLIVFFDRMVKEKFVTAANRSMLLSDSDPAVLLQKMYDYVPPKNSQKWLERTRT